ncbi:MAG: hypothetical protein M8861_09865 [marine benthic group bacterium]|nr:hypothetical protein [Gemmatimonadota bacterium]
MRMLTSLLVATLIVVGCDNPVEPDPGLASFEEVEGLSSAGEEGHDFLALQVNDPAGDNTGPIDVRKMRLVFDRTTGEYRVVITASKKAPFVGAFRINVNLFNPALGTARYPSFFSHTMAEFDLTEPLTEIILSGENSALTQWEKGHEVFTNSLDGTGNPDGSSLFRTGVSSEPHGFLNNEDYIAPRIRSAPVKIHGAGKLPS